MKNILLLCLFFQAQFLMGQVISKGHIIIGDLKPANKDFREIYDESISIGGNFIVGKESIFITGKYQNFKAEGQPKSKNLTEDPSANWDQNFYQGGLRYYENAKGPIGMFTELTFVHCTFSEKIKVESPGFENFYQSYREERSGFGVGAGVFLNIGFVSVEGMAEYIRVMAPSSGNGIVDQNENVGGVMFSLAIGLTVKD